MDRCLEGEHIENFRLEIAGSVQARYRREGVAIIIESIVRIVNVMRIDGAFASLSV